MRLDLNGSRVFLSVGGPTFSMRVGASVIRFEWHSYYGPMPINRRGDGMYLGPRHAFWTAVSQWAEWGCPMLADGTCAWVPEPDPRWNAEHIGGRHWRERTSAPGAKGAV